MKKEGKLSLYVERGDRVGKVLIFNKGEKQMENREITIIDIAKTFLNFESMTHKKLQKLCYYAQAFHLAINDEPLVKDICFEAWVHGPVCPELYHKYKTYGAYNISKEENLPPNINENSYEYAFIESIFKRYGHLSGNQLEVLTHTEKPWINARQRDGVHHWQPSNEEITEEDMANYYREKLGD